jgi:hypothetical protein
MGALPLLKPTYGPRAGAYEFALEFDEDSAKSTVGQGDASTQEDEPIFVGNDGVGVELGPPGRGGGLWRTSEPALTRDAGLGQTGAGTRRRGLHR